MKVFRRSSSGLSNQHLFHNVDLIVFLEGGNVSYSKTEAYLGKCSENTEDIIFWEHLFKKFRAGKKIKFKSVGSKTTIKEIAIDIANGQISNVMIAMDNEFDEILKQRLAHPDILYTHGYSWENDVWNETVIHEVIKELSGLEIEKSIISNNFQSFIKNIKIAVYADGYLFSKGSSFFPRKNGILGCIDCCPIDLPSVKKDVIKNLLNSKNLKRGTVYAFGKRNSIDTHKHCFGHLLADYCCQLIQHFLKNRLSLPGVNKTIVYRMGINKFFQFSYNDSLIAQHYTLTFNNGA